MNNCACCSKHKFCKFEDGVHLADCHTVNETDIIHYSRDQYNNGPSADFMHQSLWQVASGYKIVDNKPHPIKTSLEEIIKFCHRRGYGKFGLEFCTALEDDAKVMTKVFETMDLKLSALCVKLMD